MDELRRVEHEARAAGLAKNTVKTCTDRAQRFIRWLAGDCMLRAPEPTRPVWDAHATRGADPIPGRADTP